MKISKKLVISIGLGLLILIFISMSAVIVRTGEAGVLLQFGKATRILYEGLSFKIPFIENVRMLEIREQNLEQNYVVSSKDIQTIDVVINVQFNLSGDVLDLYRKFGTDYKIRLIAPRVSETINAVVARYTIEEFIEERSRLARELLDALKKDFEPYGIHVASSSIINHDFSDEFNKSIEAKKIAEQEALRAKNELEKVKYEAQAEIEKATGIAEANKIVQSSLTDQLIKQKMIDKWDGKLPLYQGNGNAIIDLSR